MKPISLVSTAAIFAIFGLPASEVRADPPPHTDYRAGPPARVCANFFSPPPACFRELATALGEKEEEDEEAPF